ncbi:tRNA-splicing endonuclease subunit Sen34 [Halotydeus destructor]|nr:tRNA-splicing endonuclease subunit Sen34 [Halotydeus destructor]
MSGEMEAEVAKIKVTCSHDKYFIWSPNDLIALRKDWRITGTLIGTLPNQVYQNLQLGLPLEISNFEVQLLLENGAIELTQVLKKEPSEESVNEFAKHKLEVYDNYTAEVREERRQAILENVESIVQVKRKRRSITAERDDDDIIQEKLNEVQVLPEHVPVQTFVQCPWIEQLELIANAPKLKKNEMVKYLVFKDLWTKGHYVTNGLKFSCDFLVYEGDPMQYHAKYMVVCKEPEEELSALELLIRGRLSVQVNKEIMVATTDDDQVVYMTFKWKGRRKGSLMAAK